MALLALMLYASEVVLHLRSRMIAGGKSFFRVRGAICVLSLLGLGKFEIRLADYPPNDIFLLSAISVKPVYPVSHNSRFSLPGR